MEKDDVDVLISEMNAAALAQNLAELRQHYDSRLSSLENEVATLRILVSRQTQIIGDALQKIMGSGSTVEE